MDGRVVERAVAVAVVPVCWGGAVVDAPDETDCRKNCRIAGSWTMGRRPWLVDCRWGVQAGDVSQDAVGS